jgi:nicotinamide-nucleotide amidase
MDRFDEQAAAVLAACRVANLTLATAESCTGGLIAAALTAIPGSSDVVDRGYVVYSDAAKREMLGVSDAVLATHGAVSEAVAVAMAEGALRRSGAGIAVAVTGIAGPGGATSNKPVGLVHLACARSGTSTRHRRAVFAGDRRDVRAATVRCALVMIAEMVGAAGFEPTTPSPPD